MAKLRTWGLGVWMVVTACAVDGPSDEGGAGAAGESPIAGAAGLGGRGGSTSAGASGYGGKAGSSQAGAAGSTEGGSESGGGGSDGSSELVNCDHRAILCRVATPECTAGEVPSVDGPCYGACVAVERCACSEPAECPDPDSYTCHMSSGHCGPYVR